ncbi:MAG: hypothetical protein ACI9KE_002832 [Polyangiales bacterium]|jgi:hypothetical protein
MTPTKNKFIRLLGVVILSSGVMVSCSSGGSDPVDSGVRRDANAEDSSAQDVTVVDTDAGADAPSPMSDGGTSSGELKAFPEAEGFGRNASGGRGGDIYKVTTLDDSGPGSLREAVSQPGRTILFEVSGYIETRSTIEVAANTSIAGQTAFRSGGQGITVRRDPNNPSGGPLFVSGGNTIVRHIRFRPGSRVEGDCCGDAWLAYETSDLIFDHVSASYSSDEMFDFTGSTDITIQNSILSEPLSEGSSPRAGGKTVMGKYSDRVSIYRTLIANSSQRNPLLSPIDGLTTTHEYEYVNCYGFNLGSFALGTGDNDSGAPIHMNIIGNYWHNPSNSSQSRRWIHLEGEEDSLYFLSDDNFDSRYRTTAGGDVWDELSAMTDDYESNFSLPQSTVYQTATAHDLPLVSEGTTLIDGSAVWATLRSEFGARYFRDAADLRIISQIENDEAPDWSLGPLDEDDFGTAYSPLGAMSSVPEDSDDDGIPDPFEMDLGSDPGIADQNEDLDEDGYTNLEEYLNSLVPR